MRGRSEKRSWLRWILVFIDLGVMAALLLWDPPGDHWWSSMLFFAWLWLSAGFFRWFDRRARRRAHADGSAPRPTVEIPVVLQAPPPRAVRGEFAARAVRHYRTAYLPLLLLPVVLGVSWFRRTGASVDLGLAVIEGAVVFALVMVAVAYVESNVRAVRRLVREGSVVQGVVGDVRPLRNKATVRFSFAGAPLRVSIPLDEGGDLEPELQVPILVARGSDLVGLVTAREILVARSTRI